MQHIDTPDATYWNPRLDAVAYDFMRDHSELGHSLDEKIHDTDHPIITIPDTRFGYILHGKVYSAIDSSPEFQRLHFIKQLGAVSTATRFLNHSQTRYEHSLQVAALMDVVLTRNSKHFSDQDRIDGIIAGLVHDLAIRPLSDQGKYLKPKESDEVEILPYLFELSHKRHGEDSLPARIAALGSSPERILAICKGQGPVGALLNSPHGIDIDNVAYTLSDSNALWWMDEVQRRDRLYRSGTVQEIYHSLEYKPGHGWVFTDVDQLFDLLHLRSVMYKHIYHNEPHRAKEAFLKRMLQNKKVSREDLVTWTDDDFNKWFRHKFGSDTYHLFFQESEDPFFMTPGMHNLTYEDMKNLPRPTASDVEGYRKRYEGRSKDGITIVEHLKPPRDATKNLVEYNGKVMWLDAVPDEDVQTQLKGIAHRLRKLDYIAIAHLHLGEGDKFDIPLLN